MPTYSKALKSISMLTSYKGASRAAAPAANTGQQVRAGVKRGLDGVEANVAVDTDVDDGGAPHPDPTAGFGCLTSQVRPIRINFQQRAQILLKKEPFLSTVGKFNLYTYFLQKDYHEADAKHYVRMAEMGVGEKFRRGWIWNKMEYMITFKDGCLGNINDCFLKKSVPAATGDFHSEEGYG